MPIDGKQQDELTEHEKKYHVARVNVISTKIDQFLLEGRSEYMLGYMAGAGKLDSVGIDEVDKCIDIPMNDDTFMRNVELLSADSVALATSLGGFNSSNCPYASYR